MYSREKMTEFQYDIPLPIIQKELLLNLARLSRQNDILSVSYTINKHDKPPYKLVFHLGKERIESKVEEDPVPGFEVLGLIKKIDAQTIFLAPKLFRWAEYQQKNRVMKWVARNPNIARDVLLAISILLSIIIIILRFFQN